MFDREKTKKSIIKLFLGASLVIASARILAAATTLQCSVPLVDGSGKLTLRIENFEVGSIVKAYEGNRQVYGDLVVGEISKRRIEIVSWNCPLGDTARNPIKCGISINRYTGDAEMYQVFPPKKIKDLWNEKKGRLGGFEYPQKFSTPATNCSAVKKRF